MPSEREIAKKELESYQGVSKFIDNLKTSKSLPTKVANQLDKIKKREENLRSFLETSETLTDIELEEKWEILKEENKLVMNDEERQVMNAFFNNVKESIAKTNECQNLYKVYINNVVSKKTKDAPNFALERISLKKELKNLSDRAKDKEMNLSGIVSYYERLQYR